MNVLAPMLLSLDVMVGLVGFVVDSLERLVTVKSRFLSTVLSAQRFLTRTDSSKRCLPYIILQCCGTKEYVSNALIAGRPCHSEGFCFFGWFLNVLVNYSIISRTGPRQSV